MEETEAYCRKMILQRTSNKSTGLQETKPEIQVISSESQSNVPSHFSTYEILSLLYVKIVM